MWTYLLILFSVVVVIGVFVRKSMILNKPAKKEAKEKKRKKKVDAEEEEKKKKVSRSKKEKVEALCKRSDALLKAGRDEEAIKCLVQALSVDDKNVNAQEKLAILYLQKEMFSAAAALFKELAEENEEAIHYSHLGLALYQQSDFEGAREAYQKAVVLDPSRPQRFVSLAQVYRSLGQISNAITALDKALELDTNNFDFLFFMATLQLEMDETEKAMQIVDALLEVHPDNKELKSLKKEIKAAEKKN